MSWAKELGIEKIFNNADEIFVDFVLCVKAGLELPYMQEKAQGIELNKFNKENRDAG
jgi:hypothetical protein